MMNSPTEGTESAVRSIRAQLYLALMIKEDEEKVTELCRKVPDHALHVLTKHGDTVLHIATYNNKNNLVLKLLEELPDKYHGKLTRQNKAGNTILHETAIRYHAIPVAEKLLRKAPLLQAMRNMDGDTGLLRAANNGKAEMFNFFASRVSGNVRNLQFLHRNDGTNALHIAILSQHFNLALQIARDYKCLIEEQDVNGMTALQLLACMPEAFHRDPAKGFLNKLVHRVKGNWSSLARREAFEEEERKYESAMELAKFLIRRDTSWEVTNSVQQQSDPKAHTPGANPNASSVDQGGSTANPLFLATKSGCIEIVEEILKVYPQAVEHIDDAGQNTLHIAIMYRQLDIFKLLITMEMPLHRLIRKIDNNGNTILHMAGIKRMDYVPEKSAGPILDFMEELRWYERVEEVSIPRLKNHRNNKELTAERLFATENNELRAQSKEWFMNSAQGSSVVAVLIATVAFTAAYTVPGGANQETGNPILLNHPLFVTFIVSDVLSLTFSLAAVTTYLLILSSPFGLEDFKQPLPQYLSMFSTSLLLSVCLMMVAFVSTILLMVRIEQNLAKIILYTCSFIPIAVYALLCFSPFITKSIGGACCYLCSEMLLLICQCLVLLRRILGCFRSSRAQDNGGSIP